jgi:hypothetical protein
MRATILLDEGVPRQILKAFPDGMATTVLMLGWRGISNGKLLSAAEAAGIRVLITTDKNMRSQNNLAGIQLAVLVLPHANWPMLRARLDDIAREAAMARPGLFITMPDTA